VYYYNLLVGHFSGRSGSWFRTGFALVSVTRVRTIRRQVLSCSLSPRSAERLLGSASPRVRLRPARHCSTVKFLEMGFIQNWRMPQWHADFNGCTPPKKRVASLEGGEGLDYVTGRNNYPRSTSPWYDTSTMPVPRSYRHPDHDSDVVAGFSMSDRPHFPGTDTWQLIFPNGTFNVNTFHLRMEFNLYFAVRTLQAVNGSEEVYTQRAAAAWHFDGSGDLDAGHNWTPALSAGDKVDSPLAEVKTGSRVPHTTEAPFNDLLYSLSWTPEK